MRNVKRFRKRDSQRSGFTYLERELIDDNGVIVGSDEFDDPPPSNKSLGGEGDVNRSDYFRTLYLSTTLSTSEPANKDYSIQYVTAGGGISFTGGKDNSGDSDNIYSVIYVAGSTATVDITANPQISAGQQNNVLTLYCISNSVILENCNGLATRAGGMFVMNSGSNISFFYSQTTNLWHETSRTQ